MVAQWLKDAEDGVCSGGSRPSISWQSEPAVDYLKWPNIPNNRLTQ